MMLLEARERPWLPVYEQPWYVIIGPPGAGKTTALLNAALRFPLAEKLGLGAVAGVGGTRRCEWWFTDEAVLIDTAGRYTTRTATLASIAPDGRPSSTCSRARPQPLNGVLVAITLNTHPAERGRLRSPCAGYPGGLAEFKRDWAPSCPPTYLFTKTDLLGVSRNSSPISIASGAPRSGASPSTACLGAEPSHAGFTAEFNLLAQRSDVD